MSRIRSKNTKCELTLRSAMRDAGLRSYRVNYRDLVGTPDVAFPNKKIAIFCDSDFWHGRTNLPASNREYWIEKLRKNAERDKIVSQTLHDSGWKVLRFSESEILRNPEECVKRIINAFKALPEKPGNRET